MTKSEYDKKYREEHAAEIRAKKKEYYEKNKESIKAREAARYAANPEYYKQKVKKYDESGYRETRLKNLRKRARLNTLKKYGITEAEYNNMFALQMGCCAICGVHQQDLDMRLAVDHNHDTGKVRSLLCRPCNTGLGNYKDNVELLKKAIAYLEGHK